MKLNRMLVNLSCITTVIWIIPNTVFAAPRAGGDLRISCFNSRVTGKQGYWTYTVNPPNRLISYTFTVTGIFSGINQQFNRVFPLGTKATVSDQTNVGFANVDRTIEMTGVTLTSAGLSSVLPPLVTRCRANPQ